MWGRHMDSNGDRSNPVEGMAILHYSKHGKAGLRLLQRNAGAMGAPCNTLRHLCVFLALYRFAYCTLSTPL